MKAFPDKHFDLAVVDPPYGIDNKKSISGYKSGCRMNSLMAGKKWDIRPNQEYFSELFRVSKNQIVWGGNYFTDFIKPSRCWFIWNKDKHSFKHSDFEMAWTSFDFVCEIIKIQHHGFLVSDKETIHPTQKPVKLYKHVLQNYAKPGDLILDTHMGSQSSRIAAYDMGFDYVGFELDEDYFQQGNKRFENFISQQKLF
jgi:site-specific DNA-methyltransferase (adenine-specific)